MESEMENAQDPASVRESLNAIRTDRDWIGERITAETWWGAPAQGLGIALIVVAPAAGLAWAWLPFVLSIGIFIGVEVIFRKRSGLGITRPAGPRGFWLLVSLFFIILFSQMISLMLVLLDLNGWAVTVAVTAGVATALVVVEYDRAYAAEVRHAG